MRLSEAILLGSTMLKPLCGHISDGHGSGCAMGMAMEAIGQLKAYNEMLTFQWPWQWTNDDLYVPLPCDCVGPYVMAGGGIDAKLSEVTDEPGRVLVHLFNYHVATKKDWSIEKLADWVRSVEPAEPEVVETETKEEVYATA